MAHVTDPIGDMLTRIRNASRARHEKTLVPASKLKGAIIKVLKDEGFIADFVFHEDDKQGMYTVFLKYDGGQSVIREIKRVSKPGIRRYVPKDAIPRVLGGLGISILSTSKGVLVDREARKANVGGELLCTVY
ncbi:30S ribosomal protein S8 [Vulgatibacter incomptus]|uniref:Small ribosomal subunit protein uS8 n=1 Tax=Vulgatibacter incomptus TaxID=1391653 RepID=A0A0K1PDH9_9BACT|nr:30S ribosomal protein S8 [Vulgatibacter incomptus]AKU91575.1 SSU ribosomal protein S8p (S15Ae) [Vulgatibacter incomptus]